MDSKLLYPNRDKEEITCTLSSKKPFNKWTLQFHSNNGKFGTDELLDEFEVNSLKRTFQEFWENNPKRALEILQEIYEWRTI